MGNMTPWDRVKFLAYGEKSVQEQLYPLNSTDVTWLNGGFNSPGIVSQQRLIDEGYGGNSSAYSIIKTIAEVGADLPLRLYQINKAGEKVLVEKGELFEILKRPATLQGQSLSRFDWLELALTYLLATGNLYQIGHAATGFGDNWQQLEFLPSGKTLPLQPNSYLQAPLGYEFNDWTTTRRFNFDEVMHTRFISPTSYGLDNCLGLSPLQAAILSLTGSTDIQTAISVMTKNQGVRGVLTNEADRAMTPEERKLAQDIADAKLRGAEKFGKVMVSQTRMNYLQIGMSATDLKIIESGVLTDRQLCNAYSFPSVLLNDPGNNSYKNYPEAMRQLYTRAVLPPVTKILDDCNNIWLSQWSKKDKTTYSWEVCREEIEALQQDQILTAQKDKTNSDAIIAVLGAPITQESKIQILVYTHSIPEETARLIVGQPLPQPAPTV